MKLFDKLKRGTLNAVFPVVCPYCNNVIYPDDFACDKCRAQFPEFSLRRYAIGGFLCSSAFPYKEMYAGAVKSFKFGEKGYYAKQLAYMMVKAIKDIYTEQEIADFDVITCVPMHKKDKKRRGFNQSELLARECSVLLNIEYADVLIKHKKNLKQHTLKRSEREKNVKGVFKCAQGDAVKDKHVLIIDDIITTGHTLGECARILKKGGCRAVSCAVLCSVVI